MNHQVATSAAMASTNTPSARPPVNSRQAETSSSSTTAPQMVSCHQGVASHSGTIRCISAGTVVSLPSLWRAFMPAIRPHTPA